MKDKKDNKVTKKFVQFIKKIKYEDIPLQVIEKAKLIILDSFANQIAAATFPIGTMIRNYLQNFMGKEQSTVVGFNKKVPCELAAWANATLAHGLDIDGGDIRGVHAHPSCKSLPVSLAVGEYIKANGKDLLTAFILSEEIQIKIGSIVQPSHIKRGFHGTGTFGVFGSCAAAGKLLNLAEEELVFAFGIAGSLVNALAVNMGTMTKSLHAGNAAQQGIKAVLLAKNGWKSTEQIIEARSGFCQAMSDEFFSEAGSASISKKMFISTLNLGDPWEIENPGIYFKAHPSCGYMQPGIELAIKMTQEYNINIDKIEEVQLGVDAMCVDLAELAGGGQIAKDGYQARYNLAAGIAVGLSRRSAGIDDFIDEIFRNPQIVKLMKKIRFYIDPEIVKNGYTNKECIIKIKMKDGAQFVGNTELEANKVLNERSPSFKMSKERIKEKYRSLSGRLLSSKKTEMLYELVDNLENIDNLREITAVLTNK